MHIARSSFLELGLAQILSQSITTTCNYLYSSSQYAQSIYKSYFHLALILSALHHIDAHSPLTLPRHLFILYKIGLNMGKPMGRHPIPVT